MCVQNYFVSVKGIKDGSLSNFILLGMKSPT